MTNLTMNPTPPLTAHAWAALWRSKNKLDGTTTYIIYSRLLPALFISKKQAQRFIESEYGYIRNRPDLKKEPHGWRMPKAVRVTIKISNP